MHGTSQSSSGCGRSGAQTVLVVEDDRNIGEFIVEAFTQETPYRALLAVNGSQALQVMHYLRPLMLVLDYRLPDMQGLELYDRIQAEKEGQDIPAFLMSANVPLQEVSRRKMHYLNKPFELDDLFNALEKLIASRLSPCMR